MSTGSIQSPSKTITRFYETYALFLTLTNGSGGDLVSGQEVYISANNAVSKRTLGTQFPIGTVTVGKKPDIATVAVATVFQRDILGIANGGTLNAGSFVRQNGTVTATGQPQYVACAAGDYAMGIVLSGGTAGSEVRVGVLRSPFQLPAA